MEQITVGKEYKFDSAHLIPDHPNCGFLHGHTYNLKVEVTGYVDIWSGMVIDFGDLNKILKPLIKKLDHKYLNEVFSFITTCENLSIWIVKQIKAKLERKHETLISPFNVTVTLQEGTGGWARVTR